ncbi:short-chain dehydrogenase/reductase [Asanoa ishikariensis]|uniref:Short-chain dehydrogenase n=1 Tax=Asanoa ishikariensis TaxID=137265 RepID=A0A1H3UE49_9ACTN|nr:SDR family NAD(P)-dependent oxidoreductase [Asanoa ishikariensis]GIF63744.1 short-chain dehydrogenase/reductase [Asanoa ishikariensis]SDZ60713.1 Short-chain dehydrogenase [Asanoa ishikariensis]
MTRTWLITGGSQGLGRALTAAALAKGDRVAITSRQADALADLRQAYPDRLLTLVLDLTDEAAARDAVAAVVERFGSLDVVVNNAGYATSGTVEDFPADEFRAQIETNLFGVVNVSRAALPVMRRQRSGHFVQVSSVGGRVGGTPGLSAYQAAKFGVAGFSEVLANEVAPLGIKVTIVEPGGIRTGWAAGAAKTSGPTRPEYAESVGKWQDMFAAYTGNEPGDPARMATAIVDLVEGPEHPRRLLLGNDALDIAMAAEEGRLAEARKWAAVSRSTDHQSEGANS